MDATIITAASRKKGAHATWKKIFGFHPLAAWCARTTERLAMLLRSGGGGSNTPGAVDAHEDFGGGGAGNLGERILQYGEVVGHGDLTAFEKKTGGKYSIVANNIRKMTRIAGSHQAQRLDTLHRHHAVVEDRVKTNKAMGLHNLPSKSWTVNASWMLTANLAAELDAWLRLLALHDSNDLTDAEPDTMRFRLYHLPARLSRHARRRLRLDRTWPWAKTFTTAWTRITDLPAVT